MPLGPELLTGALLAALPEASRVSLRRALAGAGLVQPLGLGCGRGSLR